MSLSALLCNYYDQTLRDYCRLYLFPRNNHHLKPQQTVLMISARSAHGEEGVVS